MKITPAQRAAQLLANPNFAANTPSLRQAVQLFASTGELVPGITTGPWPGTPELGFLGDALSVLLPVATFAAPLVLGVPSLVSKITGRVLSTAIFPSKIQPRSTSHFRTRALPIRRPVIRRSTPILARATVRSRSLA